MSAFGGAGLTLPIIMLTARSAVEDKVKALDLGADDYLPKPFSLEELDVRIRACLRRSVIHDHKILRTGHLSLDVKAHKVMFDGIVIEVPRREFELLHFLMTNPGQDLSREQLMGKIYGWEKNVGSNALEVHVHSLRKKFKAHYIENVDSEEYIKTIRAHGYSMNKKAYAAYFVMSKGTPLFSVKENAIYLYRDKPPEAIYALVVDDKKNKINFNVSAIAPPQIMTQLKWPDDGTQEKNRIATELPEKLEELILTECEHRRRKETVI